VAEMPMYYNHGKSSPMIELKITFDGEVPGIPEHRLSVASFGKPLRHLLMAVRRTSNNMLREATDRRQTDVGRLAGEADQIDVQISVVGDGSTALTNVIAVQVPPGQISMWPEGLAEDAVNKVLNDIEKESRGTHRNSAARGYLRSLPPGLTRQDYYLVVDGEIKNEVHLGPLNLPIEMNTLPYLIEVEGKVIGVGFEPGRPFVRIKASDPSGSETTLFATREQVDSALELREGTVRALALVQDHKKLLRIQSRTEQRVRLNTDTYIFEKWRNLLGRLAE
jgi:hypothetical protein